MQTTYLNKLLVQLCKSGLLASEPELELFGYLLRHFGKVILNGVAQYAYRLALASL